MSMDLQAVPVDRRWAVLTLTRLGLAGAASVAVLVLPDLLGDRRAQVLATCAIYAVIVTLVEGARRGTGRRALWLTGVLVVLDGIMLARLVNASGGAASPLNALVYLHLIAMTLLVSLRVGLQAALWHATLVVGTALGSATGMLTSTLWSVPSGAALRATSYLVVAIATAAFASLDERALRRAQSQLAAQVELLSSLERNHTIPSIGLVMGRHLLDAVGFTRAVVIVHDDDEAHVAALDASEGAVTHVLAEIPTRLLHPRVAQRSIHPTLVGAVDARHHPVLDRFLPGARHVVTVPLIVDDQVRGMIAADWDAAGCSIPVPVVDQLALTARYGGLALQSAFLLAEVEDRSRRDLVTGLDNRRAFDEAIESEISRSNRAEASTSLVLLDLDHFKDVNDNHGHQAGDEVLAAVGRALTAAGRPHDLVARIGGDEFAMLLPDCGLRDASGVAERARRAVLDAVGNRGVTACAGVATSPEHGTRPKALIRRADQALYEAKADGRNRVVSASADDAATLIDLTGHPAATEPRASGGILSALPQP